MFRHQLKTSIITIRRIIMTMMKVEMKVVMKAVMKAVMTLIMIKNRLQSLFITISYPMK